MSELSVTVKYGKGYEESWAVFRGTVDEIRSDIIGYFGVDQGYAEGVTLHELVIAVTNLAHGTGAMAAVLGAVPISVTEALTGGPTGKAAWDGIEDAAATALPYGGSPTTEDPHASLVSQLQSATSVAELKELWAKNQSAFSDKDVKAAYKVKGLALQAAAATEAAA